MRRNNSERGSAVLTTMIMIAVIMGVVVAVLSYTNAERLRTINLARKPLRASCAESGLQLAKAHFGRQFNQWNLFLSQPGIYDPIYSSHHYEDPDPDDQVPPDFKSAFFQSNNPRLFADLDADGELDVFIYARDNQDEFTIGPPTFHNPQRDNDQNIIVGAVCFSRTLTPRTTMDPPPLLTAEGILSYNSSVQGCTQFACGDGSGNMNN
jgi:hypothetical protein